MSCIFCEIANNSGNAAIVLETDHVVAFHDINKVADVHILIIPKTHIQSLKEVEKNQAHIMSEILLAAKELAAKFGIASSGYRLVMNTGPDAGQSVFHLHMHLLGGRAFSWPPG